MTYLSQEPANSYTRKSLYSRLVSKLSIFRGHSVPLIRRMTHPYIVGLHVLVKWLCKFPTVPCTPTAAIYTAVQIQKSFTLHDFLSLTLRCSTWCLRAAGCMTSGGAQGVFNIFWKRKKNIVFVFVTFSSENPKLGAGFTTHPWSHVVQTWTQEIASVRVNHT